MASSAHNPHGRPGGDPPAIPAAKAATPVEPAAPVPDRVGGAFGLLMQIRILTACVTLLLVGAGRMTAPATALVAGVAALSWWAARHRNLIVPRLVAHPLLAALDLGVSFAVLGIGGLSGPFFISTVVTAAVAGLLYRWPGMLAVSALQILCYYLVLAPELLYPGTATYQELVGQPAFYPLAGFAGAALRRLIDDHAAQEAARRRAEVAAASAEERTLMAREMHDSLAKTLHGIALAAAAFPNWVQLDRARAAEEARQLAAATQMAYREARSLISGLRDTTVTRPLPEAVREAAAAWSAEHGIAVRCETDLTADLALRTRHEAMAILTEALTNVARHAAATTVQVRLSGGPGEVELTVADDGRGFRHDDPATPAGGGHYGLIGLYERAERAGGVLTITSRPGAGTTVTARLPAGSGSPSPPLAEVS